MNEASVLTRHLPSTFIEALIITAKMQKPVYIL